MKKILGLDLGTTSIGSAYIHLAENENEETKIIYTGVRIVFTHAEAAEFDKGKFASPAVGRAIKRSMRRRLQRYKQRRKSLLQYLVKKGFISDIDQFLTHPITDTHELLRLRAKAATEEVSLEDLARILLTINKRRGYKSNRKTQGKSGEEGKLIDSMEVTKEIIRLGFTPGQYLFDRFQKGKYANIEFYKSDYEDELKRIFDKQQESNPNLFTPELLGSLLKQTSSKSKELIFKTININPAEMPKDYRNTQKLKPNIRKKFYGLDCRRRAVSEIITPEEAVKAIVDVCQNRNASSGYLGEIGDRSRILYQQNETIGQRIYERLSLNPHDRIRDEVYYRKDYMNEFDRIWKCQQQFHPDVLTHTAGLYIRNRIIFYQRPLKSKKKEISFCPFESKEVQQNGKTYTTGSRVAPKSSPIFQHFRLWQRLGQIEVQPLGKRGNKKNPKSQAYEGDLFSNEIKTGGILSPEEKKQLFGYLNLLDKLSDKEILAILGYPAEQWKINFKEIIGNKTNHEFICAYFAMKEMVDGDKISWESELTHLKQTPDQILRLLKEFMERQGIDIGLLDFNPTAEDLRSEPIYHLWHLLYASEDDSSPTGTASLCKTLNRIFGIPPELTPSLLAIHLEDDYASLSTKAMRKLLPFMDENRYDEACALAGYRHNQWITGEENEKRELQTELPLIRLGSLRNPVVERILNQMIHVVNAHIDIYGNPDEVHIEMARNLQSNTKERQAMTDAISKATEENRKIRAIIQEQCGIRHPSKTDILKYKLREELKSNGYHTLYSNTYIPIEELMDKKFDIEHIIPKAVFYDDSFSNKTLELAEVNKEKNNRTAMDYLESKGETQCKEYLDRIKLLWQNKAISEAKYKKLKLHEYDLGDELTERDLVNTRYITKKAVELLSQIAKGYPVHPTGKITDILRRDWGLMDIMKELNLPIYEELDKKNPDNNSRHVEIIFDKNGQPIKKIKNWSKRCDHRHHAMDALVTAFASRKHVQYLSGMNGTDIQDGRQKLAQLKNLREQLMANGKFIAPVENLRHQAREALMRTIISTKAANKVVTVNKNQIVSHDHITKRKKIVIQTTLTPRGPLHLDTRYGQNTFNVEKEIKINKTLTPEIIKQVVSPVIRQALLDRLREYDGDAQKAFEGKNAISKKPLTDRSGNIIYTDSTVMTIQEEHQLVSRTPITKDLKIEKVVNPQIKEILTKRLAQFGGKPEIAFTNLDKNPIWWNQEKGIAIKSVTIRGKNNARPIHQTDTVPKDYVANDNNHHLAVYRLPNGNIEDIIVPFYEAVKRKIEKHPIVDKSYKQEEGWEFLFSLKVNEYFLLPQKGEIVDKETGEVREGLLFDPTQLSPEYIMNPNNYAELTPHIFRVRSISKTLQRNSFIRIYLFRHQYNSGMNNDDIPSLKSITHLQISSAKDLANLVKIRVNHLGQIVQVGEY